MTFDISFVCGHCLYSVHNTAVSGPSCIDKLQQETVALCVAASGSMALIHNTAYAQLPAAPSRCQICRCSSEPCTTMDCLRAFYYYTVLQSVVGSESEKGDASGQDRSESSNDEHSISDAALDTDGSIYEARGKDKSTLMLTEENIRMLGHFLLWDIHAERYQLTEMANYISRAVAAMVTKHGSQRKDPSTKDVVEDSIMEHPEGEVVGYSEVCSFPPTGQALTARRYSGEYLPMSTSTMQRLSLDIPNPRPHEQIPMSPLVFERSVMRRMESCAADYVQMFPESHDCSEMCMHTSVDCPPTPRIDQITDSDDDENNKQQYSAGNRPFASSLFPEPEQDIADTKDIDPLDGQNGSRDTHESTDDMAATSVDEGIARGDAQLREDGNTEPEGAIPCDLGVQVHNKVIGEGLVGGTDVPVQPGRAGDNEATYSTATGHQVVAKSSVLHRKSSKLHYQVKPMHTRQHTVLSNLI